MREDGFTLRESQGILYYSCRAFESLPQLRHGFSTRRGPASPSGECSLNLGNRSADSMERIDENRRSFLAALHFERAQLKTLRQVHSNRVHIIEDAPGRQEPWEGDAIATRIRDMALAVQTADCLPVLIADPVNLAVAAVHSGWRGTLSRILLHTIQEMRRSFGSDPGRLLAAVGPGIRACCYEVGAEVAHLFDAQYPASCLAKPSKTQAGKYLLDLVRALEIQLDSAGVRPENRYDLHACTRCNTKEFFSYRAEGPATGRLMSIIGIGD